MRDGRGRRPRQTETLLRLFKDVSMQVEGARQEMEIKRRRATDVAGRSRPTQSSIAPWS